MTLTTFNTHPVNLDCSIDSSSALAINHGADALGDHGDSIFDELPEAGAHQQAEIKVADFTHNSQTHQVYAWEALPTGGLQQWTRGSAGSTSGLRGDLDTTDILIVAVPPGIAVPSPSSTNGPPAPGTTQTTVKVKVKKQGSMPF